MIYNKYKKISMDTTESSKYILGQITVRVLEDNERPRFDELLEQRNVRQLVRAMDTRGRRPGQIDENI